MPTTDHAATSIKSRLDEERAAAIQTFRTSRNGRILCAAMTDAMDRAIREAHALLPESERERLSVLALGGYGRQELFPHSDVDVMVLIPEGERDSGAGTAAKELLHHLWNAGLAVGHSVRTVSEAILQYGAAIDAWVSMLEARRVCGDKELFQTLLGAIQKKLRSSDRRWFIASTLEESTSRHVRFGSSVKLLEPNIKKSAGGLRDLHTVFWLFRGCDERYFDLQEPEEPATYAFLNKLHTDAVVNDDTYHATAEALDFLLRVRAAMHSERETPNETLEYTLQRTVADLLGYKEDGSLRPVEVFMRDYYLHARTVHSLYERLIPPFREQLLPPRRIWNRGRKVGSIFRLRDDRLVLDDPSKPLVSAAQIFEAFDLAAENEVEIDLTLHGAIAHAAPLILPSGESSLAGLAVLRKVFLSSRVGPTLREMNETDVLGRLVPEFGDLIAFFQHNVYHYYTADEHTLIALTNIENLHEAQGFLHEVFRTLRRRELLYLAVFLHDIAKPRGVSDHEITGVPIAKDIVTRIGFPDLADDVGFLVRHHLVMEQLAFRRNINDPATIRDFAERFENPALLDYLYLLTYADLSAVNPGVWTEWKASMLQELYQRTAEVLRRNLKGEEVDRLHASQHEEEKQVIVRDLSSEFPEEQIRKHLDDIPNAAYTSVFSTEEIGKHLRLAELSDGVDLLFEAGEGWTDITVIAKDAPFALSRFCAVLAANDASIFNADIFTRDDGIIFDRFRVHDVSSGGALPQRTCTKVKEDIRNVMTGALDIDQLFLEHHRKWKRRPKHPVNPNIRTDVQFEDTASFTIIDVYAPDRVGFLYRVTESISRLGLDISFARIATRVDGIVDAFYVRERSTGERVADASRRKEIARGIMTTLQSMALRELTGE